MYVPHTGVYPPTEPNAVIWRFLDFPKFVSLLQRRESFFAQLAKLSDPLDGVLPKPALAEAEGTLSSNPAWTKETVRASLKTQRERTYVNCWHMSDYESTAMWEPYTRGTGIALQSTVQRLRESVDTGREPYYVGLVQYIDHETGTVDISSIFHQIQTKRLCFEHEREVRAFVCDWPAIHDFLQTRRHAPNPLSGRYIPTHLETLLERVRLQPGAPEWHREVVEGLFAQHGLSGVQVEPSELDAVPAY